ncbi:MAG: nuclear transport factor 2 family protein [Anaerolineae bacterium]|jgi:ketosteroid isomerase-like protein
MHKNSVAILVVALVILLAAPSVMAQTASPTDVVQSYYAALGEAAAGGDTAALLALFADDATVEIVGITPEPVAGKEAIQSTLGNMFALLQGVTISLGEVTTEGDTVTATYSLALPGQDNPIPATDTFVIQDGQIQSLTIDIATEALAVPTPYDLPQTGGPVGSLLPALLVFGGAALVGLSRRFSR